ncbi:histidine phosphatase family protein [Ferrovibrio sp.]|uniref:SixA phosphatase family protein n=1 Tax=Ferrovibrio sp. TaxID=1917215 RepID=UPI0025C1DF4F|nr:histidine phosphatase family protein [Ferrovibrio sp.]MBX3456618.1 histidine phosphatase family protein [Ferrovibrio sp.]
MLRLWLLRHAKSAWNDPDLDDFARPLAPRGKKACRRLGRHLAERGIRPDLVLCSPAARTRQTWERLAKKLPADIVCRFDPGLYLADRKALQALVRSAPTDCRELLLIGHNPGLEDLAALLCGSGASDALDRLIAKYPTGGLAEISFAAKRWAEVTPKSGHLASFVTPAMLEADDN